MTIWFRAALALLAPLALAGCLFVPGKFTSQLTVRADRSFTFTYQGEVLAVDLTSQMNGLGDSMASQSGEGEDGAKTEATPAKSPQEIAEEKAKQDAQYRELAVQLAKEAGYRKVEYRGDGLFWVDYAISGTLNHGFVYPYNLDGAMIFPWVAVELRGRDAVRVKAPGFAKQDSSSAGAMGGMGMAQGAEDKLDGTFTLVTDAEIVSQNQEEGVEQVGSDKTIRWRVTPLTQDAPSAVLKVKPI